MTFDEDALDAVLDLIGRTPGAQEFQIGHTGGDEDDPPPGEAIWYAHVTFRGMRITSDLFPDPASAAEGLARKLLEGGRCAHCGGVVTLSDAGVMAYDRIGVDGTRWTKEQQAAAGLCRWRRYGPRWDRECKDEHPAPKAPQRGAQGPVTANRAARRKRKKGKGRR